MTISSMQIREIGTLEINARDSYGVPQTYSRIRDSSPQSHGRVTWGRNSARTRVARDPLKTWRHQRTWRNKTLNHPRTRKRMRGDGVNTRSARNAINLAFWICHQPNLLLHLTDGSRRRVMARLDCITAGSRKFPGECDGGI